MAEEFSRYDTAEFLKTEEDMLLYLDACLEDGDSALTTHALGAIARAHGMSRLARNTGISREGLYCALSADGNPEFSTVMKVIKALGMQLHVVTS